MTLTADNELAERLIQCVDEQRLIETACAYVNVPSPTGILMDETDQWLLINARFSLRPQ